MTAEQLSHIGYGAGEVSRRPAAGIVSIGVVSRRHRLTERLRVRYKGSSRTVT